MKNKKVIPKKLILAIFKLKQIQPGVFEHVLQGFGRSGSSKLNLKNNFKLP